MKTPICDFIEKYAQTDNVRLHMPGHKGVGNHNERLDITEITGADSLYEASGIIAESEKNASALFDAHTFYSAEGSSLSIRAMLYLCTAYAKEIGRKPLILAARNVHKTFVSAAAMLDLDVEWMTSASADYLSVRLSAEDVRGYLDRLTEPPVAVYLTSPDYLGNIADVESIAKVCHERGVLLVVDNAHGAYLRFTKRQMHPIALGADMCCDSAHKTLPALTGAAYMHISKSAPELLTLRARTALSLFGSTSPSYLILSSLDRVNAYIADGYSDRLANLIGSIEEMKKELSESGYTFVGDEPMKITISAKPYGYLGKDMAAHLEKSGITTEFSDPDYLVLMPTPENSIDELDRLKSALLSLPKLSPIIDPPPSFKLPKRALSIREAVLSPCESVSIDNAKGRPLAAVTVGCPPAVPILVCGEIIDSAAIECFKYYGIESCLVVKNND